MSIVLAETVGFSGVAVTIKADGDAPERAVVECAGYIDTYNSSDFAEAVLEVIRKGVRYLVFDLEQVNYVSSTGVGVFVGFLRAVRPRGGDIALAAIQPRVMQVLDLLGFSNFFTTADTVEQALGLFPAAKAAAGIPFAAMLGITDCFARLERLVDRESLPAFYHEVICLLKQVSDLKRS